MENIEIQKELDKKQKKKEYDENRYYSNIVHENERCRKYYQKNIESERERCREYYQKNIEKERERCRKYKEKIRLAKLKNV
jgi:hypothetical protein